MQNSENLKQSVYNYWNKASCGTEHTKEKKYSQAYFEEIEDFRYRIEPEIFSFAQFSRYCGKKVLEVGVGAGTDFLQWVRSGAQAHGIDLTHEAIIHVRKRLNIYDLTAADLKVADAEHLPYANDFFDVVYSWGVIHHSPDMIKCLDEIIRVTKPGGIIKVMIYNRHSLFTFYRWVKTALLRGRPWKSFAYVLFNDQENLGTKAYTVREIEKILEHRPVVVNTLKATVTNHDLLFYKTTFIKLLAYIAACLFGYNSVGLFMTIEIKKKT